MNEEKVKKEKRKKRFFAYIASKIAFSLIAILLHSLIDKILVVLVVLVHGYPF